MGKITSIYLTENEAKQLEKFCEENQCTQYAALKTALRELISKPLVAAVESGESQITEEIPVVKKKKDSKSRDALIRYLSRSRK